MNFFNLVLNCIGFPKAILEFAISYLDIAPLIAPIVIQYQYALYLPGQVSRNSYVSASLGTILHKLVDINKT